MVTSSPVDSPPHQPWLPEDVSPVAKAPRQNFARSASARYVRKLSYSSDSEDQGYVAAARGGSEGSSNSSLPDDSEGEEEPAQAPFSPLISFRRKNKGTEKEDEQLTSFNQSPKKHVPRSKAKPRSMIPVPQSRSKSCERKPNTVSNLPTLKHSKSGDVVNRNKIVMTPQRKFSTPNAPPALSFSSRQKATEESLKACLVKTPRSLLTNPTSATARKIVKSKSSDNVTHHAVSLTPAAVAPQTMRGRSKSGDGAALGKVSLRKPSKSKSLKKSKSTDVMKPNMVNLRPKTLEVVMKPDLDSKFNSPKSNGRSFVDWLKKRRNEN